MKIQALSPFQKNLIGNKNNITNLVRIQTYDSIMHEYFCIRFTDFMLAGYSFTDFKSFFSRNNFKKDDKVILKSHLKWYLKMIETFTNRKINTYPELDTGIQYKLNKINRIKTILLLKVMKGKQ